MAPSRCLGCGSARPGVPGVPVVVTCDSCGKDRMLSETHAPPADPWRSLCGCVTTAAATGKGSWRPGHLLVHHPSATATPVPRLPSATSHFPLGPCGSEVNRRQISHSAISAFLRAKNLRDARPTPDRRPYLSELRLAPSVLCRNRRAGPPLSRYNRPIPECGSFVQTWTAVGCQTWCCSRYPQRATLPRCGRGC